MYKNKQGVYSGDITFLAQLYPPPLMCPLKHDSTVPCYTRACLALPRYLNCIVSLCTEMSLSTDLLRYGNITHTENSTNDDFYIDWGPN